MTQLVIIAAAHALGGACVIGAAAAPRALAGHAGFVRGSLLHTPRYKQGSKCSLIGKQNPHSDRDRNEAFNARRPKRL